MTKSLCLAQILGALVVLLYGGLFSEQSRAQGGEPQPPVVITEADKQKAEDNLKKKRAACEQILTHLAPGLPLDSTSGSIAEKIVVDSLCEGKTVNFTGKKDEDRTLDGTFLTRIVEFGEFDTPALLRVAIEGAIISGDFSVTRAQIRNMLSFKIPYLPVS